MTALSESENESREYQVESNVEVLAREIGVPMEEIRDYYEAALRELRPHARIKAFLPILAGREVKQIMLEKRVQLSIASLQAEPKY